MQLFARPPVNRHTPVVNIPQDRPVYKVLDGGFYVDDELHVPGTIIVFEGEPNLEMEPLNDLARERYQAFVDKLEDCAREVAKANNKAYVSLANAYTNTYEFANRRGRTVEVLNDTREVPILGGQKKGPAKAQKLEPVMVDAAPVVEVKNRSGNNTKLLNDLIGPKA